MVVVPGLFDELSLEQLPVTRTISAVVIDKQPLFLDALATLLAAPPLAAAVTRCARSDAALEILRGEGADIVFCELSARPLPGSELVRVLASEMPAIPVILLGEQAEEQRLTQLLRYPVAGVFTKDASLDEFLVGVRAVLSGHRAIGARLMARLLERLDSLPTIDGSRSGRQLSQTEREILAMIGAAESVQAIAASRGVSDKTVRNHLAKIYRKLDLHGRTDAMLWAARMGLSEP